MFATDALTAADNMVLRFCSAVRQVASRATVTMCAGLPFPNIMSSTHQSLVDLRTWGANAFQARHPAPGTSF